MTVTSTRHSDHIPTLDGLRAVAIAIVIICHASQDNPRLQSFGLMGVMIFFALSGYLITTRLLEEHRINGRISLPDFYLRRGFRILPPALIYLAVVSALSAAGVIICSGDAIRSALFFYANYITLGDLHWRALHFWSLSVEEHFYLLWPPLLICFGVRRGWLTALGLIGIVILWRAIDHHYHILVRIFHDPHLFWNFLGTDVVADCLLWGCFLAFFKPRLSPFVSTAVAALSATLLALYMLDVRVPFTPHYVEILTTEIHALPSLMLGAIIACPSAPIGRLLELAPLRYIGRLSYSLYIWQQIFLGGTGSVLPVPLAVCAALACAYLSYRFIERPAIAYGRRLISKRKDSAGVAAAHSAS
jgi:peptidoglycan/LPS O-acetylase OafA/YrhL